VKRGGSVKRSIEISDVCGFAFITICSLIVSNLKEIHLTSKLRMLGPKINRIVAGRRIKRKQTRPES
jgi:hypothetical protein